MAKLYVVNLTRVVVETCMAHLLRADFFEKSEYYYIHGKGKTRAFSCPAYL